MCLILFAVDAHADFPLVLAATRDEFLARPTAPAGFWKDNPDILAGRDLVAGGTWLGVHRRGRVAAVTNVREPDRFRSDAASRGALVTGMLTAEDGPLAFLEGVEGASYNGFNAVAFAADGAVYGTNRSEHDGMEARRMEAGIHGLSNANLDTPWPKVVQGKEDLACALGSLAPENPSPDSLFAILARRDQAPDDRLPDTGVGIDLERQLSPPFIRTEGYGTRSSSVVLVRRDRTCFFWERTFPPRGLSAEDRAFKLQLEAETSTV